MPQGRLSGGFSESFRGHFQGVSESILRASSRIFEHELEPKLGANSNLNWNAHLKPKLDLGLKLEIELALELSNSNSHSASNAATRTRTQELELEPELYFGLQRALALGLELQAILSFRCTSSQVQSSEFLTLEASCSSTFMGLIILKT